MRRAIPLMVGTLLFAGLALSAGQAQKKPASYRCTLTGKSVATCCCEQRDKKLYCTLAKKTIEKCCCEPAGVRNEDKR